MRRLITFISIVFVVLYVFIRNGVAADKLPVFVSILPQKFFVQQIGKDLVVVQTMVLPGTSPATYEPKPKQMADLSKAQIYFAIGVPFENAWLEKIASANPNMRVVHTDHGIEKRAMAAHHHEDSAEEHHEDGHDNEKAEHHGDAGHGDSTTPISEKIDCELGIV